MASNNETRNRVIFETDEQAKNKLLQAYTQLQKAQERVAKESLHAGDSYEAVAKESRTLAKAQSDVVTVMRALDKEWSNQVTATNQATSALDSYEDRLRAVQKQGGADLSGDIASSLGGLRGATQAFGGGAASPFFDIAEGLADIGEFAPRLKVQLSTLADAGKASDSALGQVAGQAASLAASVLPTTAAGLAAVALAALPIVAIVGAVAAGFAFLGSELDKSSKAAAELAKAQLESRQAAEEAVIRGATTADLTRQIAEESENLAVAQNDLLLAQQAYDDYVANRGNPLQAVGDAFNVFGDQEQVLADAIDAANKEIQNATVSIIALDEQIGNTEVSANDAAKAEEQLATFREEGYQNAVRQQEQLLAQQEQINARIAQLEEQRASQLEARAIQENNASEVAALEARFAREDEKQEFLDHYDNLSRIRQEGNTALQELESGYVQLAIERAEELNKVQSKGQEQLTKVNNEYFSKQLKATRDFQKETSRIETDTAKRRLRLIEDINQRLNDAARDNNVIAFLEAQRDGNKQLRREAEDANESEKRRVQDFARAREEESQAFRERQSEVIRSIEDEKRRVIASYNERRTALNESIQKEKAAIQERLRSAIDAYNQEEARQAQQAQRDAQRQALRQQQEAAAFQRQQAEIAQRIASERALYATITNGLNSAIATAARLSASSRNTSPSPLSNSSKFSSFSNKAQNVGTVIANFNNTIGDVASTQDVANGIGSAFGSLVKALQG